MGKSQNKEQDRIGNEHKKKKTHPELEKVW